MAELEYSIQGNVAKNDAKQTNMIIRNLENLHLENDKGVQSNQCPRALSSTDPRVNMTRIKTTKGGQGGLRKDCYKWILDNPTYLGWREGDETRPLWIMGGPGKGKTMMMIGLVSELEACPESGIISYFFCESTNTRLNNAVSILKGLIYLLADQQKSLIRHLREKYDKDETPLFEVSNELYALWQILFDMVSDLSHTRVYLLVDALDECDSELLELLDLIKNKPLHNVKWLFSGRCEPEIVGRGYHWSKINLDDPDSTHVSDAVNTFISFEVQEIAESKSYKGTLQQEVEAELRKKAEGIFLWVALVCKELRRASPMITLSILKELPRGLDPLYDRMMKQIERRHEVEAKLCKQILRSVTITYRPLHLQELVATAHLSEQLDYDDTESVTKLVELCASFLTVRDERVYLFHQSAKDYLITGNGSRIFSGGVAEEHYEIVRRSLHVMSDTLRVDICGLQKPGVLASEASDKINNSDLVRIVYACCHWANHLADYLARSDHVQIDCIDDLSDNGRVHMFVQKYLLHWLEAMSLLNKMYEVGKTMRLLQSMISVSHSIENHL